MKNNTISKLIVGIGAAAVLFGANSLGTAFAQVKDNKDTARVRIVHASPDAPAVDVYVDGAKTFTNIVYKKVSDYASLKAGSHLLQIVPTGKTLAQGPVVISANAAVEANRDYSVLAVGRLSNIAPLILADDNLLPAPGKTRVRFVHASPDSPPVDVVLPTANTLKLFSKVGFKDAGKYTSVDAGPLDLSVRVAGTDVSTVELKGLVLEPRTVVTVYEFGLSTGAPAVSLGVSVDAVESLVNRPILPVTGGEPEYTGSVVAVMLGALMIFVGLILRRRFTNQ